MDFGGPLHAFSLFSSALHHVLESLINSVLVNVAESLIN